MENGFNAGGTDKAQGVNLYILFDRVRDFGWKDFSIQTTWQRGVYTRNFEADYFFGVYGGYSDIGSPADTLGAIQYWDIYDTSKAQIVWGPGSSLTPTGAYSNQSAYYNNGSEESDPSKRVLLVRLKLSEFTNHMPSVSSVTLKIVAMTVDGSSSDSTAPTYDICPNNLSGVNLKKSVADNYFLIPFTDATGNVLTGVSPRDDSQIVFLPGSRSTTAPIVALDLTVSNAVASSLYNRSIFVPLKDEVVNIGMILQPKSVFIEGSIKIYNLRGELVRTLVTSAEWSAEPTETKSIYYQWDGRNDSGDLVTMGTYIVTYSGLGLNGMNWNQKTYVTVMY
jgi:hypothetical protein